MPADRPTDRPSDRPSERRSAARTGVVWTALEGLFTGALQQARVLDIGGGTGGFAVRLARLGHRVTVVDPSPDALAALSRRAAESQVTDLVAGVQGDLAGLPGLVDSGLVEAADVVLCHGVLEVVAGPEAALASIRAVLRPGGVLSLLVAQRHAAVVARATAGHFAQALALLGGNDPTGRAAHRFTAEEVTGLLAAAGFEVTTVHGVRIFADLVPGSLLDAEPGATQALLELEQAAAELPEYLPLAAQVHVLARV